MPRLRQRVATRTSSIRPREAQARQNAKLQAADDGAPVILGDDELDIRIAIEPLERYEIGLRHRIFEPFPWPAQRIVGQHGDNDGDVVTIAITFVEGITFAEMREHVERTQQLQMTLKGLSNADVLKKIGATEASPEGLFFPDTYRFSAGTTDLDLLKKSYGMMQQKLAQAWAQREAGLPYKSPYEALIMASIIEKETGRADERPLIGAVFTNRLKIPMRLQTDPTVIYGMGQRFDGNIRRRDLTTDTPYNTYTRDGLPPTPIAMPGWSALLAAVKPAQSDKLYFVAKGDGSHFFSSSLDEHNRAVAKYQLGK